MISLSARIGRVHRRVLMDELATVTLARRRPRLRDEAGRAEDGVDEPHFKRGRITDLTEQLSSLDDLAVRTLLQRAHCLLEQTVLQEAAIDPSGVSLPMLLRPSMQAMLSSSYSTTHASPSGKENRRAGL